MALLCVPCVDGHLSSPFSLCLFVPVCLLVLRLSIQPLSVNFLWPIFCFHQSAYPLYVHLSAHNAAVSTRVCLPSDLFVTCVMYMSIFVHLSVCSCGSLPSFCPCMRLSFCPCAYLSTCLIIRLSSAHLYLYFSQCSACFHLLCHGCHSFFSTSYLSTCPHRNSVSVFHPLPRLSAAVSLSLCFRLPPVCQFPMLVHLSLPRLSMPVPFSCLYSRPLCRNIPVYIPVFLSLICLHVLSGAMSQPVSLPTRLSVSSHVGMCPRRGCLIRRATVTR